MSYELQWRLDTGNNEAHIFYIDRSVEPARAAALCGFGYHGMKTRAKFNPLNSGTCNLCAQFEEHDTQVRFRDPWSTKIVIVRPKSARRL